MNPVSREADRAIKTVMQDASNGVLSGAVAEKNVVFLSDIVIVS